MNNIIVKPNQTLFDIVLMACGTMEGAMEIAGANGLSISDSVSVGQSINIPDGVVANSKILSSIKESKIVFGTKG